MRINFESSTACNSHCVFCPREKITRTKGEMTNELFHKIIKEGREMGVSRYTPFIMGEPFIFTRIWEWLDYMDREGVRVTLYTNGEFLDVERLIKYKNILYVNCSLNAATPETHKKVMGISWEKAKKNIDELYRKAPFRVKVSLIKCDENIHEVKAFKKMYRRHSVGESGSWTDEIHNSQDMKGPRIPCYTVLNQMYIHCDGTVVPCCMDYNAKMKIGDANTQSLSEIWKNNEWMRGKHREGKWDEIPICKTCNYNAKR